MLVVVYVHQRLALRVADQIRNHAKCFLICGIVTIIHIMRMYIYINTLSILFDLINQLYLICNLLIQGFVDLSPINGPYCTDQVRTKEKCSTHHQEEVLLLCRI